MASGVGLCVGATECMAAIVSFGRDPVYVHRNSVLHLSFDGSALLGGMAPAGYAESIVDFTPFVGGFGPETGAGVTVLERQRPEELLAKALGCLIDLAAGDVVGTAEYYATYPAEWTSVRVARLRAALDALDRSYLTLIPSADIGTPRIAALEAGLLAHTAVLGKAENPTPPQGSAAVTAPVGALAYSAVLVPLPELPAEVEVEQAAPVEPPPSRRRTMVLVAAAVVLLAMAGVIAVVELRGGTGHSTNQGTAPASSEPVTFTVTSLVPAMPSAATPVVAPVLPSTTARPPATGQQIASVASVAVSTTQSRQTTTAVAKPSLSTTPTTTTVTVTVTTTPTTTSASGPDIGPLPPLLGPGRPSQSQLLTTPAQWGATPDPVGAQPDGTGPDGQYYGGPAVPYGRYTPQ